MELTSQFVPSDRRLLGSIHNRQVRVNDDNTDTELQQLILGPTHKRGRCIRSDRLVIIEQLHKCSVRPSTKNIRHSDKTTSNGYCNSSYVASSNMVSKINITSHRQSNSFYQCHNRTVICVGPRAEPLKNRAWRLYAWRISGRRTLDA